jgi:hypothetical protein
MQKKPVLEKIKNRAPPRGHALRRKRIATPQRV